MRCSSLFVRQGLAEAVPFEGGGLTEADCPDERRCYLAYRSIIVVGVCLGEPRVVEFAFDFNFCSQVL